jgi:hypothetical protein
MMEMPLLEDVLLTKLNQERVNLTEDQQLCSVHLLSTLWTLLDALNGQPVGEAELWALRSTCADAIH